LSDTTLRELVLPTDPHPAPEPRTASLRRLTAQGFRGIGPQAALALFDDMDRAADAMTKREAHLQEYLSHREPGARYASFD
jgi:hypothetical protein